MSEQQQNQQQPTQEEQREAMKKLMENGVDLKCSECGSTAFIEGKRIRFFNQIESPNGNEGIHPLDDYVCIKCYTPLNIEEEIGKIKEDRASYQQSD